MTEEAEYDDGYGDKPREEADVCLAVYMENILLSSNQLLHIAIECYAEAYKIQEKESRFWFRFESDASEFTDIVDSYSKSNLKKKRKSKPKA